MLPDLLGIELEASVVCPVCTRIKNWPSRFTTCLLRHLLGLYSHIVLAGVVHTEERELEAVREAEDMHLPLLFRLVKQTILGLHPA